ncbi:serine/threonine-protein kinase OXI1-like [Impatiens glandulifera]|uniref:serine/threonine-protein kinase OXI1-like n=1 Tax=Impatiens glandulifera TaxID=253017 RepID=UPI001FB069A8|nr:serine/threonine-protein kinase OXI1-like [Impatiens glandulifera]
MVEDGRSSLREVPILDLKNMKIISPLGRGAKGVVFLVRTEFPYKEFLALKVISKASVENKAVSRSKNDDYVFKRICIEREILSRLHHPLLPTLRGVVETEQIIGYAIDYCPGRDLHSLRKKQTENMFSDDSIRFYAAELVLALEYLHGLGIVYRDLKPENILIQENGHLMLVDFDLSTKLSPPKSPQNLPITTKPDPSKEEKKNKRLLCLPRCWNSGVLPTEETLCSNSVSSEHSSGSTTAAKSNSFVGTEEYIPPEIIQGNGHEFAVDWWCLGIVLHEMLYGFTPFKGSNRKETFHRILNKSPDLVGEQTPLRNLIRKLLEKEPSKRITGEEIKGHDFFKGVDWKSISEISRPPYIPPVCDKDLNGNNEIDVEMFVNGVFKDENDKSLENVKKTDNCNQILEFKGYHEANPFFVF